MLTYPETSLLDPEGGKYGLGVVDFTERLGMKVIGNGGSALGYSAAALHLPEYGTSVAWLVSTGEGPRELATAMMGNTWSCLSSVLRKNVKPQP